jgi:hypothetical protein
MAVDTRSRRASCLGIGLAAALTLPLSDGAVTQPDRQHVAFAYPGIAASTVDAAQAYITVRVGELTGTVRVGELTSTVRV